MPARSAHRRRSRSLAYVAMLLVAAAVLLLISHGFGQTLTPLHESPGSERYAEVVVLQGDTLWSIARRHGDPGADPRRLVERIRTVNRLETAVVRPGQVLRVPLP